MELKKTIVIGASPNPARFSYKATSLLSRFKHPVVAIGIRDGEIEGVKIQKGFPDVLEAHTITLYIGPAKQPDYYDYIFSLSPLRIIFNPGTENQNLYTEARAKGIEVIEDCTLVMLNSGRF